MYRWYKEAKICYTYLEDVSWPAGSRLDRARPNEGLPSSFLTSRWFSRGWTLQELIAPRTLVFYSKEWSSIGSRHSLQDTIVKITGISAQAFGCNLDGFSVAEKMSWASKRETTRVEDKAYCLLGLFDVSMPLIYGEGEKAFRRLQEEIIKESDDETIFAWTGYYPYDVALASSPSNFKASGSFKRSIASGEEGLYGRADWLSSPFTVTNKGLQISLPIMEPFSLIPRVLCGQTINDEPFSWDYSLAILSCHHISYEKEYVAILIDNKDGPGDVYTRRHNWLVSVSADIVSEKGIMKRITIRNKAPDDFEDYIRGLSGGRLIIIPPFPANLGPITFITMLCVRSEDYSYEDPYLHDDGAISVDFPFNHFEIEDFETPSPIIFVFKNFQGATILISLKLAYGRRVIAAISSSDKEVNDGWCWYEARRALSDAEYDFSIVELPASDLGMAGLSVRVDIRDTHHAWIVTIDAEEKLISQ
ncbi:hypothetical protein ANO14919_001890 [Xylariales sp. No.14919]|nr:hypothetical protein ANO14919_001890 [Xylariales sp. No.14919]